MREALFAGLARRLADAPEVELTLTFDELDEMAGGLPQAARLFPHWWSNNAQGEPARDEEGGSVGGAHAARPGPVR
jgi:hypothetical protein